MTEIELKLLIDEGQERALRRSASFAALTASRPQTITLENRYFDRADGGLRAAGIALRLRHRGRVWMQTVKRARRAMATGLSVPEEEEIPLPGPDLALSRIADDDLRETVIGLARGGLEVACETRFRRTLRTLTLASGTRIEFALDVGEMSANGASAPLREAEFELLAGAPADLYAAAEAVLHRGPVRFATVSKSARAMALPDTEATLRTHRAVTLDAAMTVEEAAALILAEGFGHAHPNLALTVDSDRIEGPHQLRVGLRRLRSALGAFRPVLGDAAMRGWADAARTIAGEAGRLRDLDVLATELVGPLAVDGHPGPMRLLAEIEARRARMRGAVRASLIAPGPTRFVLGFAGFLARSGWRAEMSPRAARPVGRFAAKALDRRWRAVARLGQRIETLSIDERHDMRKEIKKLRYSVDAFASLWPREAVRAFTRRVKRLQSSFGALNDLAMAETMLTGPGAPHPQDPDVQRTVGWLMGAKSADAARLWPETVAEWHGLDDAGQFWR